VEDGYSTRMNRRFSGQVPAVEEVEDLRLYYLMDWKNKDRSVYPVFCLNDLEVSKVLHFLHSNRLTPKLSA
jgi:hypothetical protein